MSFEVSSMQTTGLMALDADTGIPKSARGGVLLSGVTKYDETVESLGDFQSKRLTEPGNTLFWKHVDTTKRGAWGSWSFAMPAEYMGNDEWLPLLTHSAPDHDFRREMVHTVGRTPKVGDQAIVVSTGGHGTHDKIAFIVGGRGGEGSDLTAHWNPDKAPTLSSIVSDIKGSSADPDRRAGLDTIFRVQTWQPHCSKYAGVEDQYTIMLNGAASPEGQGFLPVHFAGGVDAAFSFQASGPFIPSFAAKHLLSQSADGDFVAGAIDTRAYYRGSQMPFTAPLDFHEDFYPPVQNGKNDYEVHLHYDANKKHPFQCGDKRGLWRWFVKLPVKETPPCETTKDRTTSDVNGNPDRSYAESKVIVEKQMQTTGLYFKPRADSHLGRMDNSLSFVGGQE